MINNLHVRNLALIDEAEINFSDGFNVLSGETGAGKSIIIGSLNLALGERADSDAIRQGCESALVELSITSDDPRVWAECAKMGIEHEDNEIIIKRRIYPGRSDCRINGETVTLKELSHLSSLMIDICGQRESLKLLKETALKNMLDECGGAEIENLLASIREKYKAYTDILNKLGEDDDNETLRRRKADLAEYEINEIEAASLVEGEDEELEQAHRKMSFSVKIAETLSLILKLCDGDEGASSLISRSLREIRNVVEYDEELSNIENILYDIESMSTDLIHELRSLLDNCNYDPEEYDRILKRLDLINHLKDKYGYSYDEIMRYHDEKVEELKKLSNYEAYTARLISDRDRLYTELISDCSELSRLRTGAASILSKQLIAALEDMNFMSCNLEVTVSPDPEHITASGYDHIDFMISLNPGEPLKPLSSVASGGELSRIMLAIKCVTGDRDSIATMVFDEIDTGISGVTAWKVGEKLSALSSAHQVICITHQAQIAAHANTHYLISKNVEAGRTITEINSLDRDGMINELARMMGADESTPAARGAAEDLKVRAGK